MFTFFCIGIPYGLAVRLGSTPGMGTPFKCTNFPGVFLTQFLSSTEISYVESIKVRCSVSTTLLRVLINALRFMNLTE